MEAAVKQVNLVSNKLEENKMPQGSENQRFSGLVTFLMSSINIKLDGE